VPARHGQVEARDEEKDKASYEQMTKALLLERGDEADIAEPCDMTRHETNIERNLGTYLSGVLTLSKIDMGASRSHPTAARD
jgi:hypothetical protein